MFYLIMSLLILSDFSSFAFDVGISRTRCNLDASRGEVSDPCVSLYDAICLMGHCMCPSDKHEDKSLKKCVAGALQGGTRGSSGGGLFDDLPFDYEPNKPTTSKPSPRMPLEPVKPIPKTPEVPGWPAYSDPTSPRYPPTEAPKPKSKDKASDAGGDPYVGEKAGGGVGGFVGLLLLGGLIYFCCCKGKGNAQGQASGPVPFLNKFGNIPFLRSANVPMTATGQPVQHGSVVYVAQDQQMQPVAATYVTPPPAAGYGFMPGGPMPPYGPPQPMPYAQPPPFAAGQGQPMPYPVQQPLYPASDQVPPPYTEKYQPNAPPVI